MMQYLDTPHKSLRIYYQHQIQAQGIRNCETQAKGIY